MRAGFPRVYQSFAEFEREELRKLSHLDIAIDDMLDDMMAAELDFDTPREEVPRRRRGRPRKNRG